MAISINIKDTFSVWTSTKFKLELKKCRDVITEKYMFSGQIYV